MVNFDCSAMWCEFRRIITFLELKFLTILLCTGCAIFTVLFPLLDYFIWHLEKQINLWCNKTKRGGFIGPCRWCRQWTRSFHRELPHTNIISVRQFGVNHLFFSRYSRMFRYIFSEKSNLKPQIKHILFRFLNWFIRHWQIDLKHRKIFVCFNVAKKAQLVNNNICKKSTPKIIKNDKVSAQT